MVYQSFSTGKDELDENFFLGKTMTFFGKSAMKDKKHARWGPIFTLHHQVYPLPGT